MKAFPLIFERSKPGRRGVRPVRAPEVDLAALLGEENLRETPPRLPEVDELSLVRHYTGLSRRQIGVDTSFYPLGSCTMKYNPKVNEAAAALFSDLHPYQDPDSAQGALELMYELQRYLAEITGMDAVTLQPAAGAHGELTGILIIRAYHAARGEHDQRRVVLVPDSAHGSNPATASMAGYEVREIPSGPDGEVDLEALKRELGSHVAAIMLTNPNTLGLFERQILEIARAAHAAGALLYYDGANLNAIMGWARPGDMGFDVVHLNLHKTFSVPHGGGGPGSGPVGVKQHLEPFLPVPTVRKEGDRFVLDYDRPQSIGQVRSFYGNMGALVRAYTYIRLLGAEGLKRSAALAVLNANYLKERLKDEGYRIPYDRTCMHEFVAQPPEGLRTLDIAKALLDEGYHPPTVYFPLIVKEALMVEPTETESKETLEAYAEVLGRIARRGLEDPEWIQGAPYRTPVRRLDEVSANRKPKLRWEPVEEAVRSS
ncbi:aminomethyl-transferring glycine dehydrogenase subunit GcvPB [Marinithermus hydrothermalis]|uniref:Probable glycine dehydrogenase (decarboxylating) subunit 2 n=1 Tax=Marinithermus hydrothermalis (strain DSM 14884 / JCM 11576 / T1) TaxID=869210 RepID=F2NM68_MARHT|nr:aminomethyl-transferring glycine dehydrogenase subunit GcvPB [Marinithermus hydrothermalis]AEB11538.1 glycine dehydrogenase (decarboxylating) subunit 2 [Marinithermus hydrothermalis DSM 14884]